MKIRPISDIHLEFAYMNLFPLDEDKDTILVLAGDIGLVHKPSILNEYYLPFLQDCSARFRAIVLVMGNHEHYGGSFVRTVPKMREHIKEAGLTNVHLLEQETIVFDDVAFIGATLWTDCGKHAPMAPYLWHQMNDSRVVRNGPPSHPYERKFMCQDTWVEFRYSKKYIFEQVAAHTALGHKTVVVTHHGPTEQSISPMFVGDQLNIFYASDMSPEILNCPPTLMIHGHIHHYRDYMVDTTRVICNPRGYVGHDGDHDFNPKLVVDV